MSEAQAVELLMMRAEESREKDVVLGTLVKAAAMALELCVPALSTADESCCILAEMEACVSERLSRRDDVDACVEEMAARSEETLTRDAFSATRLWLAPSEAPNEAPAVADVAGQEHELALESERMATTKAATATTDTTNSHTTIQRGDPLLTTGARPCALCEGSAEKEFTVEPSLRKGAPGPSGKRDEDEAGGAIATLSTGEYGEE